MASHNLKIKASNHDQVSPVKRFFLVMLMATVLVACQSAANSTPLATEINLNASIHVIVFIDQDLNGTRDPIEPGVAGAIGLAPDTDCTIGDPAVILPAETDPATGEYTFTDLVPGLYCVMYRGSQPLTTEPAYTLTLASGDRVEVFFGIKP